MLSSEFENFCKMKISKHRKKGYFKISNLNFSDWIIYIVYKWDFINVYIQDVQCNGSHDFSDTFDS